MLMACMGSLLWALAAEPAVPQIDTIYVVPMSHTDIGFTAPPSVVAKQMADAVDAAIEYARVDPEYVWVLESFWQLEQWLRKGNDPAPLVELLRSGRFGLSAAYATPHSSLMSAWALEWNFRLPAEWGRAQGLAMDWAVLDDVPGHPLNLPSCMAVAGVRYLGMGANQGFSPRLPEEISNRPFWWEGPDGHRVLTWICADNYVDGCEVYGIDPEMKKFLPRGTYGDEEALALMRADLSKVMQRYADAKYPYDAVMAFHAFDNWGSGPARGLPRFINLWNASGGRPRLVVSTPERFFRHIEERYGAQLPTYRGDFGGQWEPVRLGTPTAMARARAFEAKLRTQKKPSENDIARLLTYWEHSFGMGPSWPNYLTRDDVIRHNRDQWRMVARWPLPKQAVRRGTPVTLPPAAPGDAFASNTLYLAKHTPEGRTYTPLDSSCWTAEPPVRLDDGGLLLRHRLDRRALPPQARVVWMWKLRAEDASAEIVIPRDGSTLTLPDDRLLGYDVGHWIAPEGFRMGGLRVEPAHVYYFVRDAERGWLQADVLGQSREVTLKGEQRVVMDFDEAYPDEKEKFTFALTLRGVEP